MRQRLGIWRISPRPFDRLYCFSALSYSLSADIALKTSRVQTVAFALLCFVLRGKDEGRVVVSLIDSAP
jgi:hypothetical protein